MPFFHTSPKLDITLSLVFDLVAEQFPHWAHLPLRPVSMQGWDNKTFRLGEDMSIRLPSAQMYASNVLKEQKWLALLAPFMPFPIPCPLAMGNPSKHYPWHWSIYRWIKGESANNLSAENLNFGVLASQLAHFLNELHKIDTKDGPLAGDHNFYRGGSLSVYDTETRSSILELQDFIDAKTITSIWEKALSSQWDKNPLWIHGDLSAGNILIKEHELTAVIDFGGMGVGDPACDLGIAWTFLTSESRGIFKSNWDLDQETWDRACGWVLWKALITLVSIKDKTSLEALKQQDTIHAVLNEYMLK